MSHALHCDRDGCDTWARGQHQTQMLTLTGQGDGEHHFCTLNCLMHWAAAHSEPTEVINA